MWITWSPIAASVSRLWNVTEGDVDALAGVYMYVYVPGSFISIWSVVHKFYLRNGLLVGAVLNALGALVRFMGMHDYRLVYLGTLFCAMAQTFTLSVPPLISGSWFGANERGTATALGVLANQFGTAVGLGATCLINFYKNDNTLNENTLANYLGVQLGVAALALCLVFAFTSDQPPTPPSAAAAMLTCEATNIPIHTEPVERTGLLQIDSQKRDKKLPMTYIESVQLVFREQLPFVLVFGLSVGVYYTIPTFLSQLVPSWSPKRSGWLGVVYQLSGVLGSFLSGRALDRYQHHRLICLLLLFGALLSLFLFVLINGGTLEAIFGIGFCLAALNTVGLELGTAMTYPASEAAVAGILECAAELGGFVLVSIGGSLPFVGRGFLTMLCVTLSCSITILSCIQTKSKRPQ
jgi:sugar phosphate permease